MAIRYPGGWTRTDRALEMAAQKLFTVAGGDREDKRNVLVVFTDGKTNRGSKSYMEVLRPLQVGIDETSTPFLFAVSNCRWSLLRSVQLSFMKWKMWLLSIWVIISTTKLSYYWFKTIARVGHSPSRAFETSRGSWIIGRIKWRRHKNGPFTMSLKQENRYLGTFWWKCSLRCSASWIDTCERFQFETHCFLSQPCDHGVKFFAGITCYISPPPHPSLLLGAWSPDSCCGDRPGHQPKGASADRDEWQSICHSSSRFQLSEAEITNDFRWFLSR